MRRDVWLSRWRSGDSSGQEQEPSNGRRGSELLAWKRNGWRKKERRQDKREPSAFNPASPLSHGLF